MSDRVQNNISEDAKQTVSKFDIALVRLMSGIKKKVLFFIVESCIEKGGLISSAINSNEMARCLDANYNTIKKIISRLKQEGLIQSVQNKGGRGGFACFKITEKIKLHVLEQQQKYAKAKEDIYKLPEPWCSIDYSSLAGYGFDAASLVQIYLTYKNNDQWLLTPAILQSSIDDFAFDLKHNDLEKKLTDKPIEYLNTMLKRGKPYTSVTPEKALRTQEDTMLKYMENKKIKDLLEKEQENMMQEVALAKWLQAMTKQDLLNNFYDKSKLQDISETQLNQVLVALKSAEENAKEYFMKEIWQAKKQQILENEYELY